MKNTLDHNQDIVTKAQEVKFFDHSSSDDMSHNLQQERENNKVWQVQDLDNLYQQLEDRTTQENLLKDIVWDLTEEGKKEFKQYDGMTPEEFDQWEHWYRILEANKNHFKAASHILYYINHQRTDNNTTWPYNDLLYRHVWQNLLRANEFDKAAKVFEETKKLSSISGERKAIDELSFEATLAFAKHDLQQLEQLQQEKWYHTLDEFNKNTLDAMIILWKQWVWDYSKVYGGL